MLLSLKEMVMTEMNATGRVSGAGTIVNKAGWWLATMGVIFVVLGVLAIVEPVVAGLAVAILVGWLLIFGGAAHAIGAFGGGGAGRVVWQLVLAVIYVVGGFYFVTHPLLGLGTLTLFLAVILVMEAILELTAYFVGRGEDGSGWRLVNAIVTLILGGMIWRHWPSSSVWAIGTLVGVNLIMTGFSRLMLGTAVRRLAA
jgi:uncharacterized membrane protein HdeD (DUF308 family)